MSYDSLNIVPTNILTVFNYYQPILENVEASENKSYLILSTDLFNNKVGKIKILFWKNGDSLFFSDNGEISDSIKTEVNSQSVLNNVHKQIEFPITQYFTSETPVNDKKVHLVCETKIENLVTDFLVFCQSILKHLNMLYAYQTFLMICP